MDDLIAKYVQQALEADAEGREVDLDELCSEHPELITAVKESLRLDEELNFQTPVDPLLGDVLDGRYELHTCIGAGAMGAVYRAMDRSLNREVAVKVLQQGIFTSDQRHRRFVREARVLASLDHPNIVGIFDHGCSEKGHHYIVMESLVGVPLSPILQQAELEASESGFGYPSGSWMRERFDIDVPALDYVPQVVSWCGQLAEALAAAHRAGVTHRDVKPSNIFIDTSGVAILLDFGIAAKAGDGSLTAAGSTIGSPWYMAPEQATNRDAATELVDVYGLCATLYHLVTFRPPYDGDYAEVLNKLVTSDPIPPGNLRRELSRDLCAVIEKGMERNPAHRYGTMEELGDDLRALCAQMPVRARPISRASRLLRRIRRRPGPVLAVVALILAVALTIPVAASFWDAAHARAVADDTRYVELFAAVPPSLAFEGSFEVRLKMDAAERDRHIAHLGAILELQPDDHFTRLLRSALFQDKGDHAASTADLVRIQGDVGTEYMRALVARYRALDPSRKGILALRFDGLPDPQTKVDKLVAAFHLYRRKEYQDAEQLLAGATSLHARYLRLGTLMTIGKRRFYAKNDRTDRDRTLLDTALSEATGIEQAIGRDTARTKYIRGTVLLVLDELEGAIAALRRSWVLCPDAYGTNYNLGCALQWTGHLDTALEYLRRAQTLRPWNLNAGYQIARLKATQGDRAGAIAIVNSMPKTGHLIEPWHRDQLLGFIEGQRATVLFGQGKAAEARAAAEVAMSHYKACAAMIPPSSPHRNMLEQSVKLLLNDEPPIEQARRVIALLDDNPLDPVFLSVLATVFGRLDMDEELRKDMVKFIKSLSLRLAKRREHNNNK